MRGLRGINPERIISVKKMGEVPDEKYVVEPETGLRHQPNNLAEAQRRIQEKLGTRQTVVIPEDLGESGMY